MADDSLTSATYAQRIAFVCEIAGRLHSYGTTAQRLEGTVAGCSMAWRGCRSDWGWTASPGRTPPA